MSLKTRLISLLVLAVVLVGFAFSGCDIVDVSGLGMEGLMQPPMPDEEKYQIKLLLDTLVDGTITFTSPKSGTYKTACTEYDLDGKDQSDEAIVFYQKKLNGVTTSYIRIFHKGEKGWEDVGCFGSGEDEIFLVDFYDLDKDNEDEIIVLWENTQYEHTSKTLVIYEYDATNGAIAKSEAMDCEDFTVVDLQNDKKLELITVTLETKGVWEPKADVWQYSDGAFEQIGESLMFDKAVTGYAAVSSSGIPVEDGKEKTEYFPRVMVDCYCYDEKGNSMLMTYMIYCGKEGMGSDKYRNVPEFFPGAAEMSKRSSTITSRDINNDGVLDLPVVKGFVNTWLDTEVGLIVPANATTEYIVSWKSFDGIGWPISEYTVFNSKFNYILTIPEEWTDDIFFEENSYENEYVFKKWDENVKDTDDLEVYLKVRVFKAAYWELKQEEFMSDGYTKVGTNEAGTLVYAMYKGDFPNADKVELKING